MDANAPVPENPHWKCTKCGYTMQSEKPPDECSSCHERCEFKDVTCYTPECGLKGVDPRL